MSNSNSEQAQIKAIARIKSIYEKNVDNKEEVYKTEIEKNEKKPYVRNSLKVGDYIEYGEKLTSKTFEVDTSETGYSGAQNQTFQNNVEAVWRVINKKENGEVEITPVVSTLSNDGTTGLYLSGEKGFINAEKILNNICKNLYSSEKYGTARSINVEDINNLTGFNPEMNEWNGKESYLTTTTYTNGTFWNQKNNVFEDASKVDGGMTIQTTNYEYTIDSNMPLYDSLVKETKNYTGSEDGPNYPLFYWLGTRSVNIKSADNTADYLVMRVGYGKVSQNIIFDSNISGTTQTYSYACGIRPVVTLKEDVKVNINDPTKDGKTEQTAWNLE